MLSAAGHMDRLGSVLKGATPFLRALPAVLGPATLPLLALAAAAVLVAVLIWKYWGPLKAFILGVWDGIVEAVQPAMNELMTALEPLAPVWDMVSSAMGKAWAWFKKLLTPFEATSEQLQGATDAGKGFGSVLGGVLAGGVRRTAAVITTLIEAFKIVLPILKNVFGGAWQYLQGAWSMIVGLFTGDGERIRSGLSLMWQGINNILMGWPEKMMQAGRDMLAGLREGIIANAFVVREAIAGVANGAMDRFKGLLGINSPSRVFAQYGDFTMQGLAGGLQRSKSAPLQQVSGLGERMRQLGSGLALSAAIPAAAATPVMTPGTVAAGTADAAPVSYTINIHAPAGSDAQDIARLVRDAVAQIERDRNSRRASRLTD
jgi:phage-related protein